MHESLNLNHNQQRGRIKMKSKIKNTIKVMLLENRLGQNAERL